MMTQTTMTRTDGGRIAHAVRRLMTSKDWSWRHTMPDDVHERRATEILRGDAARARRWLEAASAAIDMPLPSGNGLGGPWHRTAVVDEQRRFGLLDIACGRLAITDTVTPRYVMRFAAAKADSAVSPNRAGGSGGVPPGYTQIALTYGMRDDLSVRISPLPRPRVTAVIHGLRTCYGTIGEPITPDEPQPWTGLAQIQQEEYMGEQKEDYCPGTPYMSLAAAQEMLTRMPPYQRLHVTVIEGGRHYPGCRGEGRYRVTGTPEQRRVAREALAAEHTRYTERYLTRAMARARIDLGIAEPDDYRIVRR